MIAASKGYRFVCVTDSRCNRQTQALIESMGSQVHVIAARRRRARPARRAARLRQEALRRPTIATCGLNQYANPENCGAHYRHTAPAIARRFPQLDVLFVGAGTTGTLMGCARYFREWHRPVRIVAIDSVGSITFGGPSARRLIPGLGTSVRPPQLDESYVDEVLWIEEADTIRTCHRLARRGFLFGGSTGTVVSGAITWLASTARGRELTAVAISPDLGERYLDTVYRPRLGRAALRQGRARAMTSSSARGRPKRWGGHGNHRTQAGRHRELPHS